MKILITGSHGFIAKYLIQELKTDKRVRFNILKRKKNDNFQFLPKDLIGIDVVIHLAGVMRDSNINLHNGNTTFTLQLLEAIRQYAPQARIIYASSSQAKDKKSFYGLTKRYSEFLIDWYSRSFGIRSIIFRFPNIYGPFCKPFYNSVIATFIYQTFHKQELVIKGAGDQLRDFLYVSDVVNAIKKALFYKSENLVELFELSSGKLSSINDVFRVLKKMHNEIKLKYEKGNKEKNAKIPHDYQKTCKKLNWRPKISLKKGISIIFHEEYRLTT